MPLNIMNDRGRPFMRALGIRVPGMRVLGALLAASLSLIAADVIAQEERFIEGGHYELLTKAQPVQTGEKIEVVEMFWYMCPHCYRLEPFMEQWLQSKPENAELVRIPAVLSKKWAFHARVYYTLETLGIIDQLHAKIYDAIHKERRPLVSIEQVADWVAENGYDRQAVVDTFASSVVENKLNFATVMSRKYGIAGVPSIIVDGKFRTTVSMAGSPEQLLKVINYLVKLAAKERAG